MSNVLHKQIDAGSNHALDSVVSAPFADNAARDAHIYISADIGKVVKVLSPLAWFLVRTVSAGVATFREVAPDLSSVGLVSSVFGRTGAVTAQTGDYTVAQVTNAVATSDSRLSDARTPTAHAASHKTAGSDPIKLDELAAPTDVTTLNASTSAHGLMPKGDGNATHFYCSDGTQKAVSSNPIPMMVAIAVGGWPR